MWPHDGIQVIRHHSKWFSPTDPCISIKHGFIDTSWVLTSVSAFNRCASIRATEANSLLAYFAQETIWVAPESLEKYIENKMTDVSREESLFALEMIIFLFSALLNTKVCLHSSRWLKVAKMLSKQWKK